MSCETQYNARFHVKLLHPRYLGHWLGALLLFIFAWLPAGVKNWTGAVLASWLSKRRFIRKRKKVILLNLQSCFPELTDAEREHIFQQNVTAFCRTVLSMGELFWRSREYQMRRLRIEDNGLLEQLVANKEAIIFLTPHTFGLDWAARALVLCGFPLSNIFKPTGKPVIDYLMFKSRTRLGGKQFSRGEGMNNLIRSIRQGYSCLYVADQDHGMAASVFAPFFASNKCTLPTLGRLAKVSRAKVVPIVMGYDAKAGQFCLHVDAILENLDAGDDLACATTMNQAYEKLISCCRADFMWSLKILRNQDGSRPYDSSGPIPPSSVHHAA
ncbi:LpxL/LpxP family acyltransferase [Gallaecimonas mangrovi]|uniref:LpxL/LpxP family acyltransferase n=1 Tax=Gallaecimonas mangrovi TaxID=2291597 RepID=UPI000E208C8A|nr:hypothetical protein [Gallaecimonas mangrovi]